MLDLNAAIEIDPCEPDCYYDRAMINLHRDSLHRAIRDFTLTLNLDSLDLDDYFNRAMAHLFQENYSLVIEIELMQGTYSDWRSVAYSELGVILNNQLK